MDELQNAAAKKPAQAANANNASNANYLKNLPASAQQTRLLSHRYWQRYRHLTICLLLSWFALTFGTLYFARELSNIVIFGWPVSLYMAAQGLTLIYVFLLALFSARAGAIEKLQSAELEALARANANNMDARPSTTPSRRVIVNPPDQTTWQD